MMEGCQHLVDPLKQNLGWLSFSLQ